MTRTTDAPAVPIAPPWPKRAAVVCIVTAAAVLAAMTGLFVDTDNGLMAWRARIVPAVVDSDVVIVAIDTASMQSDRSWPWSRGRYARVVDVLGAAGAAQVAFDLDFSSPGLGDDDFARTLAAAPMPVHAAVFRREYDAMPGVFAEMLPNPTLAPHLRVVSTTFLADSDGLVRRYEDAAAFSREPVPSMAFALAGLDPSNGLVTLDLRYDPTNIPVYSFVDVEAGRIDAAAFNGKTVIVGATAIELGDEFALPIYGLQSGVLLNAIAYEAAANGHFPSWVGLPAGLLLAVFGAVTAMTGWPTGRTRLPRYLLVNVAALVVVTAVATGLQGGLGLIVPTAIAYVVHGACLVGAAILAFDGYAAREFRTRMAQANTAALMESVIGRNREGVVVVDYEGRITRLNEQARIMAGCPDGDLRGSIATEALPAFASLFSAVGTSGSMRLDVADGRTVEASWSRVTLARGSGPYERRREVRINTVLLFHDITPLIEAERTERQAREQHEQASAAKSALMMTMSHELRTPLNSVIGFSDLIRDEAFGKHSSPQYTEFAQMAGDGGRQLLRVVDDLLEAARFQSGEARADRRSVALRELVANAEENLQADPKNERISIERSFDEMAVSIDVKMVGLALRHLFENVAKYAGPEATITVEAWVSGDAFSLRIRDDGPGLAEGVDPQSLTDLFTQGDASRTRSGEGCGLGLFLVRQVAEAHDGRLEIDGSDGFSATLILPAAVSAAQPDVASELPRAVA